MQQAILITKLIFYLPKSHKVFVMLWYLLTDTVSRDTVLCVPIRNGLCWDQGKELFLCITSYFWKSIFIIAPDTPRKAIISKAFSAFILLGSHLSFKISLGENSHLFQELEGCRDSWRKWKEINEAHESFRDLPELSEVCVQLMTGFPC